MKSCLKTSALALALFAIGLSPAYAGMQIGDQIQFFNGVGHPGGIFIVDNLTDPLEPNFDTFCAELEEFILFSPAQYVVDNISLSTVTGGKALTSYAAWLYDRFLGGGGGLSAFNPLNATHVNTLQFAIWKDLGYSQVDMDTYIGPGFYTTYDPLHTARTWQADYTTDVNNFAWSGVGDIRVLNVKTLGGAHAQDQLVKIRIGTQREVPEPLSIVLWSLVIACVGGMWTSNSRSRA